MVNSQTIDEIRLIDVAISLKDRLTVTILLFGQYGLKITMSVLGRIATKSPKHLASSIIFLTTFRYKYHNKLFLLS